MIFYLPSSKHVPSPGVRLILSRFEACCTDAKKSLNGTQINCKIEQIQLPI